MSSQRATVWSKLPSFWPYLFFIFLVNLLLYGPSLSGARFLFDDEQFVYKNLFLSSWSYLPNLLTQSVTEGVGFRSNLYRPIQSLTHFVDVRIWGYNAVGHRISNLFFHLLAMISVFFLVLKVSKAFLKEEPSANQLACLASMTCLFSIHPLLSSAVCYISGRGDLLLILFGSLFLLSLDASVLLSASCLLLALFSKESAIMLPFLAFALKYFSRGQGEDAKIEWNRHVIHFALLACYLVLRLTVLNFANTLNFYSSPNLLTENVSFRFLTYFSTFFRGSLLIFFPSDIHHERSWSVQTQLFDFFPLAGFLWLVFIFGMIYVFRHSRPWLSFGLFWFFTATFPTSNLVALINALIYDHWFIFPMLGLILALGCEINSRFISHPINSLHPIPMKRILFGAGIGLGIPLFALAYQQTQVWHDPTSLFEHILRYEPRSAKTLNNLAMEYDLAHEYKKAESLYRQAIQIQDVWPQVHQNLGYLKFQQNHLDEAAKEFETAIRLDPAFHVSLSWLGLTRLKQGQTQAAIPLFQQSLNIHPSPEAYEGMIEALRSTGQEAAAQETEKRLKAGVSQTRN